MANVVIDIATEFTGKKAFKEADTATQKLTKSVKRFAGAAGIAFGTTAVLAYSKASVKAYAQDEAAALRLNRAVENLGIGFANPQIADYIANLEKSAAIADDVLRPAFQGLLTTTGSLTQSQKLLNDAITISRASGVDLATVTQDLGKGYVGITRGLAKYNTGLTRAELNTKSFNEILGIILGRSAGAAEDYLSTTSYQMEVLGVATGNASEIIGQGLVAAFARIGGGTEASDAATAITTIAKALAAVTVATGTVIGGFTGVFKTLKNLPKDIFMGFSRSQTGLVPKPKPAPAKPDPVNLADKKFQELLAKLEEDAIKRQKELNLLKLKGLATQKKLTADKRKQEILDKAALVLAQGQKVFDEEGIQLAAAAQGKLTDEERTRIALKKDIYDLEAAINEGNISAAARLSSSMVANAQKLAALRGDMIGLNDIENPFTAWLETLKLMAMELAMLAKIAKTPPQLLGKGSTGAEIEGIIDQYLKLTPEDQTTLFGSPLLPKGSLPPSMAGTFTEGPEAARMFNQMSMSGSMGGGGTVVNVNVTGSVTTERDLVAAITQGLYAQQASGTPVNYSTAY
jgi:hypothetical protein